MDLLDRSLVTTELVKHAVRHFENMAVTVFGTDGERHHADISRLVQESGFWSNVLEYCSIGHQQSIACLLPTSLAQQELRLALAGYGAIQVTLDPAGYYHQWHKQIADRGCRLLFTNSHLAGAILAEIGLNSSLETVIIVDDQPVSGDYPAQVEVLHSNELRAELGRRYNWCPFQEGNLIAAGNGDDAPLSHRKAVLQALSAVQSDAFNLSSEDRLLVLESPSPENPLLELSMCLLVGADLLIADPAGWTQEELIGIIQREGITKVVGADALVSALDRLTQCQASRLSFLRELFFSDEQLTRIGYARLQTKFDIDIKHYWRKHNGGLGGFVTRKQEQALRPPGARARPLFPDTSADGAFGDDSNGVCLLGGVRANAFFH